MGQPSIFAAMDSNAAEQQITQMISFILSEAKDKQDDILKKGEEEFQIEVHRVVTEQKDKIRQTYEKKVKQIETKYAIEKSMAINKQRLEKIKARQEVMGKIHGDVKKALVDQMKSEANVKPFVTKLIVQGLLMLLEAEVEIRCKESDVKMVEAVLSDAAAQYSKVIQAETKASKTCKLTVNKKEFLPSSLVGGVVLACQGDKIKIDNTIDLRLKLVMEQDKPAIRQQLFGEGKAQPQSYVNGGSPKAPASNAMPAAAAPAAAPVQASQGELKVGQSVMARYTDGT